MNELHRRSFYVARHGKTEHNTRGLVSHPATPLTDVGRGQARDLSKVFNELFPSGEAVYLVSSELPRTVESAEIIGGNMPVVYDKRLNEFETGVLGGIMRDSVLRQRLKKRAGKWPKLEGVDTVEKHRDRVIVGTNHHLNECPPNKTPVFISHALNMGVLASAIGLNIPFDDFKNATLYHFDYNPSNNAWGISEVVKQGNKIVEVPFGIDQHRTL